MLLFAASMRTSRTCTGPHHLTVPWPGSCVVARQRALRICGFRNEAGNPATHTTELLYLRHFRRCFHQQRWNSSVFAGGFTAVLREFTAVLREFTAVLREFTAVLREFTAVLRDFTAVLRDFTAVLREFTVVLRDFTAVLRDFAAVLRDLTAVLRKINRGFAIARFPGTRLCGDSPRVLLQRRSAIQRRRNVCAHSSAVRFPWVRGRRVVVWYLPCHVYLMN